MNALEELTAAGGTLSQFFTDAYLAQARAYAEPLRIEGLFGTASDLAQFLVIFGFALHVKLHRWCEARTDAWVSRIQPGSAGERYRRVFERVWRGPGMGAAALFVFLLQLARMLLALPENVYFGFIRERREGLTHQSAASWAYDFIKSYAANSLALMAMVIALYALMRWLPRRWPVVIGTVCAVVMLGAALLDPLRSQLIYTFKPLPDGPLRTAIIDTLRKGHVEYQNVVVQNLSHTTVRGDAYFAGEGPTRLIVIGDTLLDRFTPAELSAIVAHEMGHLNESVWPARIASGLSMLAAILGLGWFLPFAARRRWFGLTAPSDVAGYILIFFLVFLAELLTTPISSFRSRARETDADQFSLQLTRDPQSFASMMAKLCAQNRADPAPWGWYELWYWDHPATARRLAHALRFAHEHQLPIALQPPQDATPVASK